MKLPPRSWLALCLAAATSGFLRAAPAPVSSPETTDTRALNAVVTGSPDRAPTGEQALEFLGQLVAAAQAELARPGANPADLGECAATLGTKTEDAFAFVRDRIATEPYAGQLRGAAGTLAARGGNAVDKSLLLAALLRAQSRECRFVRGTLSPEAAQKLVAQTLATNAPRGALADFTAAGDDPTLARLAQHCGRDVAPLRAALDAVHAEAARVGAATRRTTDAQAAYLQAQLAQAELPAGRTAAEWRERLTAAVSTHVWVQVRTAAEPETWLDLDPAFATAKPGETFATEASPVDGEPAEKQTLQFTLVYQRTVGGSLDEKTLLDLTLAPDDPALAHAKFAIQPADPLPSAAELAQLPPDGWATLLREVKHYRALFQVGTTVTASDTFDLSGEVAKAREASPAGLSVAGGGFGLGGGDEEPAGEKKFSALVVKLAWHGPGVSAPTQRRTVFTAADAAADCTATPLVEWELLLQTGVIAPTVAGHATLSRQVATLAPALKVLRGHRVGPAEIDELSGGGALPFSRRLLGFAQVRATALAARAAATPGVAVFFDHPQLVLAEHRVCFCPGRDSCGQVRIDIADNGAAFVPRTAADEAAARGLALWQGVFDTVAEDRLLAAVGRPVESAIAVFERACESQAKLRVWPTRATDLPVSMTDRSWIGECEPEAGFILTADSPGVPTAWWSYDPATGGVLGRTSGGFGGATSEYSQNVEKIAIKGLKCLGKSGWVWAREQVRGNGSRAGDAAIGAAAFRCTAEMLFGFVKLEFTPATPEASGFVDWAVPEAINAIANGIGASGK